MSEYYSRRDFLAVSGGCAAHLALASSLLPPPMVAGWARPRGSVVAREPFGTLEKIADGVWALVSSPLSGDRTTLSNGGLIAGRRGVIAIEGFNQPAGARWLGERSLELTGRWPTHVVVTHYHADHANGVAGYLAGDRHPDILVTDETRGLVLDRNRPDDDARLVALGEAELIDATTPASFDLGGRTVRVVPRGGHTPSDVTLEIDDPSVVFCGDLFWNGMFPNFVDARPRALRAAVRGLRRDRATIYVPGHGAVGDVAALDTYSLMLDEVEQAATRARQSGVPAADAASTFTLPASLGAWTLFGPTFFERAFAAWYRELEG